MFNTTLEFRRAGKRRGEQGFSVHLFVFRTPKRRCIIVECLYHDIYPLVIIQFFDKAHRLSDKRYSLLSGSNEAGPVIRTAIEIMLHLYKENPDLSFGFMGAVDDDNQNENETRRFRIYKGIMKRLFSKEVFQHIEKPGNSLYLLLNRTYCQDPQKQENIFHAFAEKYP